MEIERKFRTLADFDKVKNILVCNGFIEKGYSHQIDTYFVNNEKINGKRIYLRLRHDEIKNKYSFDFHEIISELSTKETEMSVSGDDYEKLKYMMIGLNHQIKAVVDKTRMKFKNNECEIVLDNVVGLGTFIEIEVEGADESIALPILQKYQNMLSLRDEDIVSRCGYPDLIIANNH
ncbi:MAG: class IV adenylate cyclase [Rickettsiales bacterium]|jgi:predicted adenylyl cyclase CyaB|nr:class IV adenylate cyclase [Rickettsiales bacterium]